MLTRRAFLATSGMLMVTFRLGGRAAAQSVPGADRFIGKPLNPDLVDSYLAIHADGSLTIFVGKVDIGTGGRIAMRQIVAEELDVPPESIAMIEGDTALTPNQGATAGSYGIARGGTQLRQAAATARQALMAQAAQQLGKPMADLDVADGVVRAKDASASVAYGDLIGDRAFNLKIDPKALVKSPDHFRFIGKSLRRPDIPTKMTGLHRYVHDLTLPGMVHARVIRPPAHGATLVSVDDASIAAIPTARVVRIQNFLAVAAEREWDAVRAASALKTTWTPGTGLPDAAQEYDAMRASKVVRDQEIARKGDVSALTTPPAGLTRTLTAQYRWPIQTHGSIGPSCGVADVTHDGATVWSASQSTHKYWPHFAKTLGLPVDKVRLVYVEGSGCYGMNGHEDAAVEAALLSQLLGRPVRVQWMREDEHGWDPKGPPQMLELRGTLDGNGKIVAWDSQTWLPEITKGLPNIPLLAPEAAGIDQPQGESSGQVQQNAKPPYLIPNLRVVAHWLRDTPLRPSHLRAPGRMANILANEAFMDELALAAGADPLEFRLRHLADKRGIELLTRTAARASWVTRASPNPASGTAEKAGGRGLTYIQYNNAETYVAMVLELEVARDSGAIRVTRVVVGHDCGLAVNPDGARNQIEGAVLQSISRALHEEITFDRSRVTSVDWSSYRLLTFPEMPDIEHEFVQRLDQPPWGVGEPATTLAAAAISNAVFDATGVRLRRAPFTPDRVKAALTNRET